MYAIISKGELLALCERPRYVKRNEETGAYVEAAEAEAIGIAVGGEVYNLPGGTAIPDAPEALAQEGEAEEYVSATTPASSRTRKRPTPPSSPWRKPCAIWTAPRRSG